MPYLIDGHNLIPKLGLRLDSIDDEMELVAILQEFARLERRQVDVYFDGAPAGQAGTRKLGTVRAHFVPLGDTADNAIRARLKKMGRDAKNWIVVSSDRQVQIDARTTQAQVLTSDKFAGSLIKARNSISKQDHGEHKLTNSEIKEWLDLFDRKENE